jgi:hypothetical protein
VVSDLRLSNCVRLGLRWLIDSIRSAGFAVCTATLPEERLNNFCAAARQHSGSNFHLMVQLGVVEQAGDRVNGPSFRVIRPVNQAPNAGMNQRPGAHRARLNCSKELAVSQTVVAKDGAGGTQGYDLGVRGGVVVGQVPVPAPADQLPGAYDDRSYRHFAHLQSALGGGKSLLHPEFVGSGRGSGLVGCVGWVGWGHGNLNSSRLGGVTLLAQPLKGAFERGWISASLNGAWKKSLQAQEAYRRR